MVLPCVGGHFALEGREGPGSGAFKSEEQLANARASKSMDRPDFTVYTTTRRTYCDDDSDEDNYDDHCYTEVKTIKIIIIIIISYYYY